MTEIFISMGISAVLAALKDPQKRAQFRAAFLKVHRSIGNAFPLDPDFHPELKADADGGPVVCI